MMGRIGYRAALGALFCVLTAAAAPAGEPGKDAAAIARQRAIEAAKKKAAAERAAKKKAIAAAAAAKKDGVLRPRFKVGEKRVEAVKDGKVVWKLEARMPIGGVIAERTYWYVFSKDEKTLQRVHATSGKLVYTTRFRVQNKAQAVKLVDQYLAALKPVKLTPEVKKQIEKFIKDLGSREFSVRDAASKALVKIGKSALPALKAATKSKDLETAERATAAIEQVQGTEIVAALRRLSWSTKLVIYKQRLAASQAYGKLAGQLAAAVKAGKKDDVAKLKVKLAAATGRLKALDDLQKKILGYSPAGGLPAFGVQGLMLR